MPTPPVVRQQTAELALKLVLGDQTISTQLLSVIKPQPVTKGYQEQKFLIASTDSQPVTKLGLSGATLTLLVPSVPVDLVVHIGGTALTWSNVSCPVLLPTAITSVEVSNHNASDSGLFYIFQSQ